MPLDAVCLTALTAELSERLVGMKIDKVQQPERDLLLLSLRGNGENLRLLLSAAVGSARVHVTRAKYEQPQSPPMFCMLLRKHLQGGRISAVTQPPGERLITIEADALDELGVMSAKRLVVEMMGRHSNFILVGANGLIIDCLRRVDAEMSERRQVLPGMLYRLPPAQEKPDFFTTELPEPPPDRPPIDKWLMDSLSGLSPLICRELAHRSGGDWENLRLTCAAFRESVLNREFTPVLLTEEGRPKEFSFMNLSQYRGVYETEVFDDFSELLEAFYTRRDKAERMLRRSAELKKTVKTARDRVLRRTASQREELLKSADRDELRRFGDIITANLYRMKKGESVLEAEDFYAEDCPVIKIPLDPLKTPQQNAARYFKDYNRAKTAEIRLGEQIEKGSAEAEYLDSVLDAISRAEGERDLTDIKAELTELGYLRRKKDAGRMKQKESAPMRFVSSSGLEILVGRNNSQNDRLTLKIAHKSDLWLHTQKIHGSHVILCLEGGEPDETSIAEAATLAAFYSQAREGTKVPVDYARVKFVKKPSGALPGMVIYTDYKTVLAEPDEAAVNKMKRD